MWNAFQTRGPGMTPRFGFDWRTYTPLYNGQTLEQLSSSGGSQGSFSQKMDPVSIGLAVGVPLVTSLINNSFQSSANKRNAALYRQYLDWQRESQVMAQNYNTMMWHMNNRYNSPANQMALLRQAGLNPNLMYGGAFQGNAQAPSSSGQSASGPGSIYNPLSMSLGNPAETMLDERTVSANENLANSQANLNNAEADLKNKELGTYDERFEKWKTRWSAELDNLNNNTRLLKDNMSKINAEIGLISAQKGLTSQEAYGIMLHNIVYGSAMDDIIKSYAIQNNLDESYIKVNLALSLFYNAQAEGIRLDNQITRDCMDYIKKNIEFTAENTWLDWSFKKDFYDDMGGEIKARKAYYNSLGGFLTTKKDWAPLESLGNVLSGISGFIVPLFYKGKLLDRRYHSFGKAYQSNPFNKVGTNGKILHNKSTGKFEFYGSDGGRLFPTYNIHF